MINTSEKVLAEAELSNRSISRMLGIIKILPKTIPLEEQQVNVLYSNLGIGVSKVNQDSFDGLFYGVSYGTDETEANTQLFNHSYSDQQQDDIQTLSFISLPKSLPKHLEDEQRSTLARVVFYSMRNDKLYRVRNKTFLLSV
ncbi:uncharacterized protein LOC118768404 [Octopus sinensis]|uniref:Uncharacterized protein LOC118768404 n=1 Tax=Octopus sinensis TaxID=2607531 RepID=A0A7E6FSW0_9MOLL|nr:uncharacterized protein LOC118768404 [Octopus sinensis]